MKPMKDVTEVTSTTVEDVPPSRLLVFHYTRSGASSGYFTFRVERSGLQENQVTNRVVLSECWDCPTNWQDHPNLEGRIISACAWFVDRGRRGKLAKRQSSCVRGAKHRNYGEFESHPPALYDEPAKTCREIALSLASAFASVSSVKQPPQT
jgi:hypothetical protein